MSLKSNPDLRYSSISQNSSRARNGGDLSTTNYVWDTSNINVCFESFGNTIQQFLF